ncbi:Aminopeptidase Q, partial [Temnothorax longispinosus]
VYPNYNIKDLFVSQTLQEALRLDTDSIMKPLISEINGPSDIDSGFSFAYIYILKVLKAYIYYIKAPAILRMLQRTLREFVFQDGLKKYFSNDLSYSGKTNIEAFWTAVQAAYEEHNKYEVVHFNVKEIMEAWMTQEHYPVIKVTQNETFMIVTTERTNTSKAKWSIPYISTSKEDPGSPLSKSMPYVLSGLHITYMYRDWLMVNLQQIGK